MKRSLLFLTGALVVISLFSASFLLFVNTSHATPRSSAQKPRQTVIFPTRGQSIASHVQSAVNPHVYGSGDLQYHGGNAETTPQVYAIFWGPGWQSTSPEVQIVQNYFNAVSGTPFENILTQYYGSLGTPIDNTLTFGGTWLDTTTLPTDHSCGGSTVQNSAIANEVTKAISTKGWPKTAMYFVYTPNGYYVNDGFNDCSDQNTATGFCAYHSGVILSQLITYAAIPYPSDLQLCGVPASPNGNLYAESLVNLSADEQFQTITDPDLATGWYDSVGFEIASKCAWDFSAGATKLGNSTFVVQTEYSNVSSSCVNTFTAGAFIRTDVPVVNVVATPGQLGLTKPFSLINSGILPLNWSANSLPSWVTITPTSGSINPHSSQQVSLTFNAPNDATQAYTTDLVVTAANTINAPFSIPITMVLANVSRQWYFGEGFTGAGFTTYLTLMNTSQQTYANVQVKYLLGSGAPVLKKYLLSPSMRYTINVNGEIGPNQNVSMVVTADQPIVAERPMYFTFGGKIPGGSDVLGATKLSTDFDFGYLDTTSNHDTYLTILNPQSSAMDVAVSYFPAAGGTPTVIHHTVPANSRGTVHVNTDGLPQGTYSALVHLSLPGLVERPLYLKDAATGYTGAGDVVGVAQPLTDWYFAEGFVSSTFTERYILSNPSTTGSATGTITFFLDNALPKTTNFTLAPGAQTVILVNSVLTGNNSAHVQADHPILAERFMSFKFGTGIPGATDVLGAASPANLFEFAEGFTGTGFSEYLTIENPSPTDTAIVQVTFLSATGDDPIVRLYAIAPSTRFTLNTATVMPKQSFSMIVESDVAIVAERPMYFNFPSGRTGGSDVVGYQPPGVLPSTGLTIYQGAWNGSIYAIDANNGTIRWRYQTGGAVQSTAAVVNGIVYVGSDDSYIYALHASDGALAWRYQTGGAVDSSPQVVNGIVYVGSKDDYLYALDATTGMLVWRYQMSAPISTASPAVSNGVVYMADSAFLYALDASTGEVIWKFQEFGNGTTTPAVSNGTVYYCDGNDLIAINASTGDKLWNFHSVLVVRTGVDFCNLPVVSNGMVYIGGDDGNVYAFDSSTGAVIWKYSLGVYPFNVGLGNGAVYVDDSDQNLVALDTSTGAHLWTYSTGAVVAGVPAVANGYLYFGNSSGSMFAIDASDQGLYWGLNLGTSVTASPTLAP